MINWIKNKYKSYKKTEELNRKYCAYYNARKHALLALSYWKDCEEQEDVHIQIEHTTIFVRLGK